MTGLGLRFFAGEVKFPGCFGGYSVSGFLGFFNCAPGWKQLTLRGGGVCRLHLVLQSIGENSSNCFLGW